MGSTQQPLDSKSNALPTALPRKICEVRFKTVSVNRYSIATMLHVTAQNRAVDQLHQACTFIKTENIAVNEIGRIICSHILLRAR